ncbi:MFS transporter [Curtobacterium ammoniigenes]|uniref:MFS transporter n=1 Tax=Curtobacterium ammoniigenes TaxID=395387 RepID=UPI000836C1C9|nr:MFS transporter [Curtobacterium ammoniigenes]
MSDADRAPRASLDLLGVPPFVRTGSTWFRYGQLGLVGFVIDGYAPTVRLVARDLHIPVSLASLHATAFGLGFIVASFVAPRLTARVGRITTGWLGAVGLCLGVGLYLLSPVFAGTLAGIGIAGFSGTLVQSSAYAHLSASHGANSPRAMSEGSAVAQATGMFAPVAVGVASTTVLGWRGGLALDIVLVALLGSAAWALARRRSGGATRGTDAAPVRSMRTQRAGRLPTRFWGVWASVVVVLGIEFCMSVWAPVDLARRPGIADAVATASPAFMLGGMLIGRVAMGRLTQRWPVDVLMVTSIAVSLIGFGLFWAVPIDWVSVVSLAVAGLGIAGQFPLSLARLVAASDGRHDVASAWGTLALGIAIAGAPALLGVLGAAVGVTTGLLLVPLLCLVSGTLVALTPTSAGRTTNASGHGAAATG